MPPRSVNDAFLDSVRSAVPDEHALLLDGCSPAGPRTREFRCAYKLADEALRWGREAVAQRTAASVEHLRLLGIHDVTELGEQIAVRGINEAKRHEDDGELQRVCLLVAEVGQELRRATNRRHLPLDPALVQTGRRAADVLLAVGAMLGDWAWVVTQAGTATAERARAGRERG